MWPVSLFACHAFSIRAMRFLRRLNPWQSRCEVWTAPPENQQKCLPVLATAVTTRDNLGSCLPVSALSCLVLPCFRHRHPVRSPSICTAVLCPGIHNTLAEANIGALGFSKPRCGVIWRTLPQGISSTPVTTRPVSRPVEGAMEDLTYHSGMSRVGNTSGNRTEPITDV
jgi:hypothetical protein